jgi:hypothetical protein
MDREPSPTVLTDEQRALLAAVLNALVPARGELPGAGDLGIGGFIERVSNTPTSRRLLFDGLAAIQLASLRRAGREFAALDAGGQEAALREVEVAAPRFFAALVAQTYRGYYVDPRVHAAIGFDSRPPQPSGHVLPVFDAALLDRQRQREPFWRRTS